MWKAEWSTAKVDERPDMGPNSSKEREGRKHENQAQNWAMRNQMSHRFQHGFL